MLKNARKNKLARESGFSSIEEVYSIAKLTSKDNHPLDALATKLVKVFTQIDKHEFKSDDMLKQIKELKEYK
jgi:hypothetical protein